MSFRKIPKQKNYLVIMLLLIYLVSCWNLFLFHEGDGVERTLPLFLQNTTYHSSSSSSSSSLDNKKRTRRIQPTTNENPPRPHPHAGARFANGSWGYVADVNLVRRWMSQRYSNSSDSSGASPPSFYLPLEKAMEKLVCRTPIGQGIEKRTGWNMLTQKVVVDYPQNPPSLNKNKLLCAIYTNGEDKHRRAMVKAIAETWGWRCDGFFAASIETVDDTMTDESRTSVGIGQVDLPHEGLEEYENLWQKIRSIFAYMYDHYLGDFDFFFLGGDDVHVIVENLRGLLNTTNTKEPLYLGHWIPCSSNNTNTNQKECYFCGGGAGYVLNRLSLRILVEDLFPTCFPHLLKGADDVVLGDCFRTVGIMASNSVDAVGAQRFHGMLPHEIARYQPTQNNKGGFYKHVLEFWGEHFGGYMEGLDLVSRHSVSFHGFKRPPDLRRHHAMLYESCPKGTVLGDARV